MYINILFIIYMISEIQGENYNLFGIPGHGYLVEVRLGHPQQHLNVLLDTGSSTLAVASVPNKNVFSYFHSKNSTTFYDSGKQVSAEYCQGGWSGKVASDVVQFPSLEKSPVRSDIVLIMEDHDFFMYSSSWQGILGLAYPAIAVSNSEVTVQPWLESVDKASGVTKSFRLTLCGVRSRRNATHFGKFDLIDDRSELHNSSKIVKTPILKQRWYEVGVLGVRLIDIKRNKTVGKYAYSTEEMCHVLNAKKSIVDSGTTNIRLPAPIFNQIVGELMKAAQELQVANSMVMDDDFWLRGEAGCWQEPQDWSLPWLAIDLLNAGDDHQYFTIELPPQNYIRLVSAHDSIGTISQYCYNLGLESDATDTVLGVAAMEGFEVLFNRSHDFISWKVAECGPDVRISGPYKTNSSLVDMCKFGEDTFIPVGGIKSAQWAAGIALTVSMVLLLYFLAPCFRNNYLTLISRRSTQIRLSSTALVDQDS